MAVDTKEKRLSMLGFGRRGFTLPVATGAWAAGERLHLLGLYSGITPEPPSTETAPTYSTRADFQYTRETLADFPYTRSTAYDFVGRQ